MAIILQHINVLKQAVHLKFTQLHVNYTPIKLGKSKHTYKCIPIKLGKNKHTYKCIPIKLGKNKHTYKFIPIKLGKNKHTYKFMHTHTRIFLFSLLFTPKDSSVHSTPWTSFFH